MLWGHKKGDKTEALPELPAQRIPSPPIGSRYSSNPYTEEESEEIHSLPSFPDSPMNRGFSQSAIKGAVENSDIEDLPKMSESEEDISEFKERSRITEMNEWVPKTETFQKNPIKTRRLGEEKPVFVRLDKFKAARDSLEIVKDKLSEIDSLLNSIREIKMKEDKEIISWEKEIESVKARLNSISLEVFDSAIE